MASLLFRFGNFRASSLTPSMCLLPGAMLGVNPEGRPPAPSSPAPSPRLTSCLALQHLLEPKTLGIIGTQKTHIEYKAVCYNHPSVIVVNISFLIKVPQS